MIVLMWAWIILTVVAIGFYGWWAFLVSMLILAIVLSVIGAIGYQISQQAVPVAVAKTFPTFAEFIAMVKTSGLGEEAKKRLRLKAIRNLAGAHADYLAVMEKK